MMLFRRIIAIELNVIIMVILTPERANCLDIIPDLFGCDLDCKNGGTCIGYLTKSCQCPTNFTGPTCEVPSVGLCSNSDTTNEPSLFLITFGSGPDLYSDKVPSCFNFTTELKQQINSAINDGMFGFVNAIPDTFTFWHARASDHTENDENGYMYLANVGSSTNELFRFTVNNLCIGSIYEFSAYLANVIRAGWLSSVNSDPNICFEVRTATSESQLLAELCTSNIEKYDKLTWYKYGLSFIASDTSIVLLMISNVHAEVGNDIVIDDIQLRICPVGNSDCSYINQPTTAEYIATPGKNIIDCSADGPSTPSLVSDFTENYEKVASLRPSYTYSSPATSAVEKTVEALISSKTSTSVTTSKTSTPLTTSKMKTQITSVTSLTTSKPSTTVKYTATTSPSSSDTTKNSTTTKGQNIEEQHSPFFVPKPCEDPSFIGLHCDIPRSPCQKSNPCLNHGTCHDNSSTPLGYNCLCAPGFTGPLCNVDNRLCKPHTCLDHGICNETSNTTYECICYDGWEGNNCESMINYCKSNPCTSNGVCRAILLNYTCECLSDSYSGRHCENSATKIIVYKIVSKSLGYIAILAIISAGMFIVIMDILKYCFGIDPVEEERKRMRRNKQMKRQAAPVIKRSVYITTLSKPLKSSTKHIKQSTEI